MVPEVLAWLAVLGIHGKEARIDSAGNNTL